jgi:hypothetical protein
VNFNVDVVLPRFDLIVDDFVISFLLEDSNEFNDLSVKIWREDLLLEIVRVKILI